MGQILYQRSLPLPLKRANEVVLRAKLPRMAACAIHTLSQDGDECCSVGFILSPKPAVARKRVESVLVHHRIQLHGILRENLLEDDGTIRESRTRRKRITAQYAERDGIHPHTHERPVGIGTVEGAAGNRINAREECVCGKRIRPGDGKKQVGIRGDARCGLLELVGPPILATRTCNRNDKKINQPHMLLKIPGVVLDDRLGDHDCLAGRCVNHCTDEVPLCGKLARFFLEHLEAHLDVAPVEGIQPCLNDDCVRHRKSPLELDMESLLVPVPAVPEEFLHGHAVATTHLVVARKEDIVEILRAVHMVVHVNVVGADAEFGGEAFVGHG